MSNPLSPSSDRLFIDRERVIAALTRHFTNDNLTETDFEARLESVYAATSTRELEAITADLPMHAQGAEVKAFLSGQERKLTGVLPRELAVRARPRLRGARSHSG